MQLNILNDMEGSMKQWEFDLSYYTLPTGILNIFGEGSIYCPENDATGNCLVSITSSTMDMDVAMNLNLLN